jgi:YfiH family protein
VDASPLAAGLRQGACRVAFTSRTGGVSAPPYAGLNLGDGVGDDPAAVAENRSQAARSFGTDPDQVVWMAQVHGRNLAFVDGPRPGPVPATDAIMTSTPALTLAVLVADCVPVLLFDEAHSLAAAVHAGRPGLAAGVVLAAVEAMASAGATPATTDAVIGPAVCAACYEVPSAMRDEVCASVPQAAAVSRAGTPALDLRAGVAASLLGLGVRRIRVDNRCTAEDPALFSYRRDGTTGRFAGLVRLPAAPGRS